MIKKQNNTENTTQAARALLTDDRIEATFTIERHCDVIWN